MLQKDKNIPVYTFIYHFFFQVSDYLVKQAQEHGQKVDVKSKEHQEIIENIFGHEDKDKDGVISHEEFSGPKHDEL